jgi:hypothetical protein
MVYLMIILELCAAIIVFVEQAYSKEKYRRILLVLAGIVMIGSPIYTYFDSYYSKKNEIERKADLLTIQKLSSSLNALAFEIHLNDLAKIPVDTVGIQFCFYVYTMKAGTGLFADYLMIGFSPDSGFFNIHSTFQRFSNFDFVFDKENKLVKFVLRNFGISLKQNHTSQIQKDPIYRQAGWEPETIADLGRLRMAISIIPLGDSAYFQAYGKNWSPIDFIRVYANSFDPDNLLCEANRSKSSDENNSLLAFYPSWANNSGCMNNDDFTLEPLHIRDAIFNSLNK